jgi:4-hydroxymandelate oxidase
MTELEAQARRVLAEEVYHYFRQGARDGITAAEAVARWDRFRFLPRVLRDVTRVDPGTTMLGTPVRAPIAVAPTTLQRAAHPDGEIATARAAKDSGTLMVLSSNAGSRFEDVAATGVDWWLQMYVTADRPTSLPVLERAAAAGAKAVVLTVDTPVVGTKYGGTASGRTVWEFADPDWLRVNFPEGFGYRAGDEKATDLGPQDVTWLAAVTGLPVVVKGVLHPADARRSVDAGAAAVWVSNHGGRQLDGAEATADALSGVLAEVGGSAEVYVDGGIRVGRHVLAALGLGARAVFLGRPVLYALAVGGSAGVRRLLDGLHDELVEALRLTGCAAATAVGADILVESDAPYRTYRP